MTRRHQKGKSDQTWGAFFEEQRATLTAVAGIFSPNRTPPGKILEEAIAALEGSPVVCDFGENLAIRAVVKASISFHRRTADSAIKQEESDAPRYEFPGISPIGTLPWPERAVYFLREVLRYSRRDTALLLGMSDGNIDQLYSFAERRIRYSDSGSVSLFPNASESSQEVEPNPALVASLLGEDRMLSLDSISRITEDCRKRAGLDSQQGLRVHRNQTGRQRYRQEAQMIVKGFLCFLMIAPSLIFGQGLTSSRPTLPNNSDEAPDSPAIVGSAARPAHATVSAVDYGQQTKRIMFIVPNFHSVSAGSQLPPQSAKEKLLNATQDSFDYSSFIFVGTLAGVAQAQRSMPEFGQGSLGYGRYYWHILADQTDENYLVEGLMPILFRQDTRYYTLGRGGLLKRILYAMSRAAVTRTDAGQPTPNYSEVIGAGAAAGLSNLYYPSRERTWTKTGQRWATNVGLDVFSQTFKEFWPDLDRKAFKGKF